MMFATQPVYQQQQQQQQQQQEHQFSNPIHTTATTPFARTHSHYSTPTRPSPLSPRRHHSSPFSTSSTMTTPSSPNTSNNNNINNLFSSPLANTANTAAGAAPTDPETPLTTFLPSSPLQPDPSSASCFGSPVQKPFSTATSAGPLFSFNPDSSNTRTPTTTSPIASSTNNPSRFATRYAAQIANPLANAAARSTRRYTGTSASPAARTTRRNAFLNRVRRDRADGRFENRGEQLVLLEHVAEQKRWGEAMRRSAVSEFGLGLDGLVEEEEETEWDEGEGESEGPETDALDQYLLEQERGALAAEEVGVESGFDAPAGLGSGSFSDEDYDDIFMDLAGETGMEGFAHSQEMDMS